MNAKLRDLALDALLYPFSEGVLAWQHPALFLRGRMHAGLPEGVQVTQAFRPEAVRLQQAGLTLLDEDALPATRFPLVLVLPPRQRNEARAVLARAFAACAPGGQVVMAASNDAGAKSLEADFKQLAGSISSLSKFHARVAWATVGAQNNAALIAQWQQLDAPRWVALPELPQGGFHSRPGVFAWDRVDAASRMLADVLPAALRGSVADLGGGWGYLAQQVLARCPQVTALDVFEADARALALAEKNLAAAAIPLRLHWQDVTQGVPGGFDAVVCNPPFHGLDGGERPDLGRAFIGAAAHALKRGGQLWLVANRHLPYEDALRSGFAQVQNVAQGGGFKIVHAVKA